MRFFLSKRRLGNGLSSPNIRPHIRLPNPNGCRSGTKFAKKIVGNACWFCLGLNLLFRMKILSRFKVLGHAYSHPQLSSTVRYWTILSVNKNGTVYNILCIRWKNSTLHVFWVKMWKEEFLCPCSLFCFTLLLQLTTMDWYPQPGCRLKIDFLTHCKTSEWGLIQHALQTLRLKPKLNFLHWSSFPAAPPVLSKANHENGLRNQRWTITSR